MRSDDKQSLFDTMTLVLTGPDGAAKGVARGRAEEPRPSTEPYLIPGEETYLIPGEETYLIPGEETNDV